MGSLTDPENKLVYQMHQYLDTDGSGTSPNCVSSTVGAERLVAATNWLRANKKIGLIGEFAGGVNAQCQTAIAGMLQYMNDNSGRFKLSLSIRSLLIPHRRVARRSLVGCRTVVGNLHVRP